MSKYVIAFFFIFAAASTVSAQQLSMAEKLQLREDCGPDIKRLCPGMRPGGGQLMGCIQSKKDQLSKTCSDTMAKLMAKKQD